MLEFEVKIKPLTVNQAWQGRRFSTPAKKQYEKKMELLLPRCSMAEGYYEIHYDFYIKNYALTDLDNMVKVSQDCLVKKKIISDDRKIIKMVVRKFKDANERIVFRILHATV